MKPIFFLFAVSITFCIQAQDVSFVVYHTRGQVTANGKLALLKKGGKLYPEDIISIGKGSSVTLLCSHYEALQVSVPGRYTIQTLQKRCAKKSGNYTATYFQYVWEEFTHPHGSPEKDPTRYMRNSGAVSRGCDRVETKLSLDTVIYAGGELPVSFRSAISRPFVTVFSAPEDGEVLHQFAVHGNSFSLDSLSSVLKIPGTYYWQLTDQDVDGCPTNLLQFLTAKDHRTAVQKIIQHLPSLSPAETAFLKGYLLEEAHFLAEARRYYRLAVQLDPANKNYQSAKSRFYE